ncbi:YcdB/YcdC domain-containing protein [Brevibacillus sp. 179-C 1.1 NHS]|uniref:YcdB/YcdC domain-containing protein n=1 Tax=Brevibacillus sp. 179-C 1.1 NHS TaxID=3235177 RepID=UPI0039A0705F
MDVDKQIREAVRDGSQESVEEVRFTKEMELRIRGAIAKDKHKNRNRIFMAGSLAACLAVTAVGMQQQGWFPPQMPSGKNLANAVAANGTDKKNTEANQNSVKVAPEEAILPLKKALPALSKMTIRVDSTRHSITDVTLLEGDNARATVAYDTQTGQIESFMIEGERLDPDPDDREEQQAVTLPSAKTAESVARVFLQDFLGEESKAYRHIGTEVYRNDYWAEGEWMSVNYQRMENGHPVPFDIMSVRVNSKEQVAFFGRINKSEQAFFTKLTDALPDMNHSLLLFDKAKNSDGMSLDVGKVNKVGHQASLRIVGNGQALEFYSVEKKDEKKAEGEKAKEQERQFLSKLLGADSENYRLADESKPGLYQRYHNGLPVLSDVIRISTDEAGNLLFFNKEPVTFDASQYPDVSTAVSEKVAIEELSEHMKLRYVQMLDTSSGEKVEKGKPVLEYTPGVSFMLAGREDGTEWNIDATTGKIVYGTGNNGLAYDQLNTKKAHAISTPKDYVKVRSKEEAKALLQAEFGIQVDDSTYRESTIDRDGRKEYVWNDKNDKYIGVEVIAETGSVVGLGTPRSDTKVTVKREQAEAAALAFLHKYVDPGVTEVQLAQVLDAGEANPVSSGEWGFEYFMSKDGIPVLDDDNPNSAYSVTVDPSTGKVTKFHNFRERHELVELPAAGNIVSKDKAVEEYLRVMPLKLVYLIKDVDQKQLTQPKLAYVPWSDEKLANKRMTIDAVTGEIITN